LSSNMGTLLKKNPAKRAAGKAKIG